MADRAFGSVLQSRACCVVLEICFCIASCIDGMTPHRELAAEYSTDLR